ncbi:MAG: response regulator transcription factor [Verrucomicrobiales bacterium]|nr:response regulator transcription factor [Verrucomicrobiales bacterium]MCP5528422.1 response regulator transcription factor [Verrucomicrobiales bacterium]
MIRTVIVEDNDPLRQWLAVLIVGTDGLENLGAFSSAEAALPRLGSLRPDVLLLDRHLPGMSGVQLARRVKERFPATQILMLTVEDGPEEIFEALEAGASGYLVKRQSPTAILAAIQEVHRGGAPMSSQVARLVVEHFHARGRRKAVADDLTARERDTLEFLAKGYRTKEIARELGVTADTIHTHLRHIYEKLHVRSRGEAIARYLGG